MKKVTLLVISAFSALALMSCGTTPEAENEEPVSPVEIEETQTEAQEELTDNESILAKIEEARKAALEAGADVISPDVFTVLEKIYGDLKSSDKDISESGKELAARYQSLADYIQAKKLKTQIDEEALAEYDQKDYDDGVASLLKAEEGYKDTSVWNPEVADSTTTAIGKFKNVINIAYKKLAKEERDLAYQAKKMADSVKAGVSKKDRYTKAVEAFQKGDTLYAMQSPEKAYENYSYAKETFNDLYDEVYELRSAAQAAIEEAKKRVAESEQFAEEADVKAPITEQVEGIEDEDAVLLEADDYADPEEAEIDVPEDIDDEFEEEITEETIVVGEEE